MNAAELRERTLEFGLRIVRLCQHLQRRPVADVLAKQLLRCGTSVGANYRAASLAKSPADFVSKIKICEEEADESIYWLELLVRSGELDAERVMLLQVEATEIRNIMSASAKTARNNLK
jgi:four helix bundle protein